MSKSYLTEAFKSLAMLNEEDFELNDDGVEEMQSVLSIHDDPIEIIDTEAETVADLEETHIGDAILDCVVCHSKLYKNPKDIIIDDAGEGSVVNYGEECPYCYSTDGFKLIGQIAPFEFEQETEVKVDDEVVDDDEEEKEVEVDVEEKDEVNESLDEGVMTYVDTWGQVDEDPYEVAKEFGLTCKKIGFHGDEVDYEFSGSPSAFDKARKAGYFFSMDFDESLKKKLSEDISQETMDFTMKLVDYSDKAERLNRDRVQLLQKMNSITNRDLNKFVSLANSEESNNLLEELADRFRKAKRLLNTSYFDNFDESLEECKTLGSAAKKDEECERCAESEQCDECSESSLTEKNWTATIAAGSDLRKAISAGDHQGVLDGIKACYKEMFDKGVIDEDDFNSWTEDLSVYAVDDEDIEDSLDYELDNLYDACDNLNCWLALDEKLSEDIKHTETLVDDEGTEVVVDGKTPQEAEQKAKQLNQKLGNKMKTVAKNKVVDGQIQEEFEKVDIDTGDEIIHVSSEDKEEQEQETSEEVIVPPTPELEAEVENNTEEAEEDKEDNSTVDVDFGEFDEETFDTFGESYLKKVYNNVESYETTEVKAKGNELVIEGVISFKSGKQKKTSFIFEAKDMTKNGNARFVGRNESICNSKKAFTLTGKFDGGKFLAESFNYNYRAKDTDGKTARLYGTFKK